jgi:acyltransferase
MAFMWLLPSLSLLIATFDLNRGPFVINPLAPIVIMAASQHGHVILFLLTALAGTMLIMSIARLTPDNPVTRLVGSNTLSLMGLNGLFYSFLNERIVQIVGVPSEPFRLLGIGLLVASISILVCLPVVFLLNLYLPQLIGKPETQGPILPNLLILDYRQKCSLDYE